MRQKTWCNLDRFDKQMGLSLTAQVIVDFQDLFRN